MHIDKGIELSDLSSKLDNLFELAGQKISTIDKTWDPNQGTPVFTVNGYPTAEQARGMCK